MRVISTLFDSRMFYIFFFFSSRRRHTRFDCDWSSDVCSYDLIALATPIPCQRFHVSSLYQDCRKKASRQKNQHSVQHAPQDPFVKGKQSSFRSEERRVGKESRSRWSTYH